MTQKKIKSTQLNLTNISVAGTVTSTGASGSERGVYHQTGALNRWSIVTTSDPEGGSNSGSNLVIVRFDDTGNYLGNPLSINRQTGAITSEGETIATGGGTLTFTNKRITARVSSSTSTSSLTIDANSYDQVNLTALAANLTINAPTGTPTAAQKLVIRIKDNGTARTFTWNAIFRAIGTALPTSSVVNKTVYIGMIYNSTDTKWDVISVAQEN